MLVQSGSRPAQRPTDRTFKGMPSRKSRKGTPPAGVTPFDHPYYWAAFILVGDPS